MNLIELIGNSLSLIWRFGAELGSRDFISKLLVPLDPTERFELILKAGDCASVLKVLLANGDDGLLRFLFRMQQIQSIKRNNKIAQALGAIIMYHQKN